MLERFHLLTIGLSSALLFGGRSRWTDSLARIEDYLIVPKEI